MVDSDNRVDGQRVVLGLSGGVDSAVAALLLKRAGAEVHALHMTNWEDADGYCSAAADLQDARGICAKLDIPLHHVNFSAEYRDQVFAYFLDEYRNGRTPNPDVLCNREIKFGVYRDYARRLGGELLATGHYARVAVLRGEAQLLKGRDRNKDQSYFLHAVSQEALADSVFPLGSMTKAEVRYLARDAGLDVHDKKDSTGICFIGERPFREFLSTWLPAQPGPIKTVDGEYIGDHAGLMFYTPGQRQGLGIGGRRDAPQQPYYVLSKVLDSNTLVVVQGDDARLYSSALDTGEPSWIGRIPEALAARGRMRCTVKIRYRQPDQACEIRDSGDGTLRVCFDEPQRAVAPGQFAVFYQGERCLGGAVINSTRAAGEALRKAI